MKNILLISAALLFLTVSSGCSRTESTSRTSKTVVSGEGTNKGNLYKGNTQYSETPNAVTTETQTTENTPVAKTETTATTEKRADEPKGVIGTTLDVIGKVLAFPFKVIAGAIEFIF